MKRIFKSILAIRLPRAFISKVSVFGITTFAFLISSKQLKFSSFPHKAFQNSKNIFQSVKESIGYILDDSQNMIGIAILIDEYCVFYLNKNDLLEKMLSKEIKLYFQSYDKKSKIEIADWVIKEDENLIFGKISSFKNHFSGMKEDATILITGDPILTISIAENSELNIDTLYICEDKKLRKDLVMPTQKLTARKLNSKNFGLGFDFDSRFAGFVLPDGQEIVNAQYIYKLASMVRKKGKFERPYLGMSIKEAIYNSDKKGLLVVNTFDGSPCANAGIKMGDILIELNGQKIETIEDYFKVLGYVPPNTLKAKLSSKQKIKEVEILL